MQAILGAVDSRGNIYILDRIRDDKGVRFETKKLAPDTSLIAVLAKSPGLSPSNPNPFQAVSHFAVDGADNLVYGYPLTYEIRFYRPSDQGVFKIITRDYERVAITTEEKERQEKGVPLGTKIEFAFPKYHSAYRRFFTSDLGHIFVETWETTKDGKKIHDIFDSEGRFISRTPLRPTGIEVLKGKYYALEEDEEGYQYVKRYSVTWTVK